MKNKDSILCKCGHFRSIHAEGLFLDFNTKTTLNCCYFNAQEVLDGKVSGDLRCYCNKYKRDNLDYFKYLYSKLTK